MARLRLILGDIASWVMRPVFWVAGFLSYLVLRALRPWIPIRIGLLMHGRIGHLSTNTEIFLRRIALKKEDAASRYIFFSGRPANSQLLKMIQRRLAVVRFPLAGVFYKRGLEPFVRGTPLEVTLSGGFNPHEYDEFEHAPPQLQFADWEMDQGRRLLSKMGIPAGAPFVCIHSRDKLYLDRLHTYNARADWAYHDFRDCDIENYMPAAEYLASQGIYVIRMGYLVEKPLASKNPKIIDYASLCRDDFGDVFLSAHCKFFLGCTAGLFCVAQCFNVPIAAANFAPLGTAPLRKEDVFLPKKYWSSRDRRMLSFPEVVRIGGDSWWKSETFEKAQVQLRESSGEEILALAQEMNARLDGSWQEQEEDEALQARFRSLFPVNHSISGFPSRVGAQFLRENRSLLP